MAVPSSHRVVISSRNSLFEAKVQESLTRVLEDDIELAFINLQNQFDKDFIIRQVESEQLLKYTCEGLHQTIVVAVKRAGVSMVHWLRRQGGSSCCYELEAPDVSENIKALKSIFPSST